MTSTTIVHNDTPTGDIPLIANPARPRGGWISDNTRQAGRHRAGPGHRVHVSAIDGVDLARRPQRIGAGAKTPTHGLLARLLGGGA